MYKVSREAKSTLAQPLTGGEYVYYDAAMATRKEKLALSPNRLDKGEGALFHTLGQLYGATALGNKDLGWFFYNDEVPGTKDPNSALGHTKGVLAFDLKANTAFWLVQSTPLFPAPGNLQFPQTGFMMAQAFLCITLKDVETANLLAKQMYSAQQPNVYAASAVPAALNKAADGFLALLMAKKVAPGTTPVQTNIPFSSKGGQAFRCIAKNKYWGKDFYNDLVGPALGVNLEVETWEHDPVPGAADSVKSLTVTAMKSVDLSPIGVPIQWSEEVDHAKLAIASPSESKPWICVGDINFTIAQEKRSGGTVAFLCDPLWKGLAEVLETQAIAPARPLAAAGAARAHR
jgi:deoxyribonuclease-2